MSINYPTLAHFRHFSSLLTNLRSTTVENIRQITPFYAKQTQFCALFARKRRFHEKTNPIQTQLKPIQSQFNPKQTQFKPNKAKQTQCYLAQTTRFATIGRWLCNGTPKVAIGKPNRKYSLSVLRFVLLCTPRKVVEKC